MALAAVFTGIGSVQAAVSVTTNPAAVSKTPNDDSYSTVGAVAFGSGNKNDWASGVAPRTYELAAPANWQFLNSGVSASGAVLSGAPAYVANVDGDITILRWSISTGVNPPGTNTISGIQIRPIPGKAVAGSSGSMTLSGISAPTSLAAGTFTVTQPAVALRFVQNVAATVQNGVAITPAVTVEVINSSNARVTGLPNYTISLAGTGLTLGNATATTASGLATFTGLTVTGLQGAGKTLTATATGLTSANSSAFTLTTGTPNKLGFVVQPGPVAVGGSFSPSVQVAVQDAGGNTVTTATNQIGLAGTGVSLAGTTSVTPVNGVATFAGVTVSGTAGSGKSLRATSTGLTLADSSAFVLSPGAAATLSFTQQPSNV